MPIYVFVMHVLCLQCMLGPRAFKGRHVDSTCVVLSCREFILRILQTASY